MEGRGTGFDLGRFPDDTAAGSAPDRAAAWRLVETRAVAVGIPLTQLMSIIAGVRDGTAPEMEKEVNYAGFSVTFA